MSRGSSNRKMEVFDPERRCRAMCVNGTDWQKPYHKRAGVGWIVFGPRDVRSGSQKYHFSLERLDEDKVLRVRAGCRYYTIAQAFNHWDPRRGWANRRTECRQARAIIALMIYQAQAYGFLSMYNEKIKFELKLKPRPKRK